jgi:Cu+-exporting ATPase
MNMGATAPAATPTAGAAIIPRPLAGGSYTCAMHPSVASNGPGTCPYCGMALTKRP